MKWLSGLRYGSLGYTAGHGREAKVQSPSSGLGSTFGFLNRRLSPGSKRNIVRWINETE
jgi:hypothetical protein